MTVELADVLVPEQRLRAWIDDRLPGEGRFEVERVTTGHSNELFALRRGGERWLLRRPPRVPMAGAHDVVRESRILSALAASGVPCPVPIAVCDDPEVIGAPFFVMDHLDGHVLFHGMPPELDDVEYRQQVGIALVDALAAVHAVDWRQAGLGAVGRPDGHAARQASRWTAQLKTYRVRTLPELDAVARWLESHVPQQRFSTVVHGDFGLHNVLFEPSTPARVQAVLDWETATMGDPLTDVGYLLGNWLSPDEQERWFASSVPFDAHGFSAREELVARYEAASGREVGDITWYHALGRFKIAVILEGSYARHLAGMSDDPFHAELGRVVPNLAAHALAITEGAA